MFQAARIKLFAVPAASFLLVLALLFCAHPSEARVSVSSSGISQHPDSSALASLGSRLDNYINAMLPLPVESQNEECDFLISSCRDSVTRQYVALRLFRSYYFSKLMGVEAVAVHIFDRWFSGGEVRMSSDIELMNARIFADFNRSSLVGMKAPQLTLRDGGGRAVSLFGADSSGVAETGRYRFRILYFYDTGCANCLATSILLRSILQEGDYDADLYAVYSGADSLAWRKYAAERFSINAGGIRVFHLWDPEADSDFQRKYGVLQTPMLFLVSPDGSILGRHLDAPALKVMLDSAIENLDYEYGGEDSESMLDAVFTNSGDTGTDIRAVIDTIAGRSVSDNVLYAHVIGDLLYYLSAKPEGKYKESAKYLIDEYIIPKADVWKACGDSLEVLGYAETMNELLSRSLPGSTVPDINVTGRLLKRSAVPASDPISAEPVVRNLRTRSLNLRRLPRKDVYVMFYSEACPHCQEMISAACRLARTDRRVRVLLVNMDENLADETVPSASPDAARESRGQLLLDAFDLTSLPNVMRIARGGRVIARYIDFRQLL